MSYFKDMLAADVDRIFLNLDEFAEKHNINGKDVVCVIDKHVSSDSAVIKALGVYSTALTIYVNARDLPAPKPTGTLRLDSELYNVISASQEDWMLVIVVEGRAS